MVRRYYCDDEITITEQPNGKYVEFEDYDELESENARLREALRESLKLSGFLSSCARGGEALSEKEEAWITKVGQKAREVLGDD